MMRQSSAILLVAWLVAVVLPATTSAATLEVEPPVVPGGSLVRLTGVGFEPSATVVVSVSGETTAQARVVTDGDGRFVRTWDSTGQAPGRYRVLAGDGDQQAAATVAVGRSVVGAEWFEFEQSQLDAGWWWLRERSTHWSLDEVAGVMRVYTLPGSLTGTANDQHNLLLQAVPSGGFRVTARLELHADQEGQHGGIYLYRDDGHWLSLVRAFLAGTGPAVVLAAQEGGAGASHAVAQPATVMLLKLAVGDGVVHGYVSTDGLLWQLVAEQAIGFAPTMFGLSAANGNARLATEIPADFDWLRVDRVNPPDRARPGHSPGGALVVSELMMRPLAGDHQWVELVNTGPRPVLIAGLSVANRDGVVYAIPDVDPLPGEGMVLIRFDGSGPAADDTDSSDGLVVLHSSPDEVDPLDEAADEIAVHGAETIVAYMAYGEAPMRRASEAVLAGLWRRAWFVPLRLGTGWEGGGGVDLDGFSIALLPGAGRITPRSWALYTPASSSPGAVNGAPGVAWSYPPPGTAMDANLSVLWQRLGRAATYRFQLDSFHDFATPVVDLVLDEPRWRAAEPVEPGSYWWRVRTIVAGHEGPWSAPSELDAFVLDGLAKVAVSRHLDVPWVRQAKDTQLLCVDGDDRASVDAWDRPHPTTPGFDHGEWNCVRACIAMVNRYYGGGVSQDYLAYVELENWGQPFRYLFIEPPRPQDEWPEWVGTLENDLGHCYGTGPGSDQLAAWAWGVAVELIEKTEDKSFSWIRERIDDGRPIIRFLSPHSVMLVGYRELADGSRQVELLDPAGSGLTSWEDFSTFQVSVMTAPPAAGTPHPVHDMPSVHVDSDGDGVMDFDEEHRFGTDPNDPDSDGDGIGDKEEIGAPIFDASGGYLGFYPRRIDSDGDGLTMANDSDSDDDGFADGCEDANRNGVYEPSLGETSSWNDRDHTGCAQLHVQLDGLPFDWAVDRRSFQVTNAGGGALHWRLDSLPSYLTVVGEHPGMVLAQESEPVVLQVDRSSLPDGETTGTFTVITEPDVGWHEMDYSIWTDRTWPSVGLASLDNLDLWAEGCPRPTATVEAVATDAVSGVDQVSMTVGELTYGMQPVDDVYAAVVGPLEHGLHASWLRAVDHAGNSNQVYLELYARSCATPEIRALQASPQLLRTPPCHDDQLRIEAEITSAAWDGVVVEYDASSPDGGTAGTVVMTAGGDSSYSATLGPFPQPSHLSWRIVASGWDESGTVTTSALHTVEVVDCASPEIGLVTVSPEEIMLAPCQPDVVTVEVDEIAGGTSAEAWFRPMGASSWSGSVVLQQRPGDGHWLGLIAELSEPGGWELQVAADSAEGGQARGELVGFEVVECPAQPPVVVGVRLTDNALTVSPCNPTSTTVEARVSAENPLERVELQWRHLAESVWWTLEMVEQSPGELAAELGPFDLVEPVELLVRAVDSDGLEGASEVVTVAVLECETGPVILGAQLRSQTLSPPPCEPSTTDVQATVVGRHGRQVDDVRVELIRAGSTIIAEVVLESSGDNLWSGTLTAPAEPDLYDWAVVARDEAGDSASSPWYSLVVVPCEITPPTIDELQIDAAVLLVPPCEPDHARVTARVADPLGVDEVTLRYRARSGGTAAWLAAPMETQDGQLFRTELSGLTTGVWLYAVEAVNTHGVGTWSEPRELVVRGCAGAGPQLEVTGPSTTLAIHPCRPSRALVRAEITDPLGVDAAYLLSSMPGGRSRVVLMEPAGDGEHAAVLGPLEQGGTGSFLVMARNTAGSWTISPIQTFDAVDCTLPVIASPTASPNPVALLPCDTVSTRVGAEVGGEADPIGGWVVYQALDHSANPWRFVPLQVVTGSDWWGADLGPFANQGQVPYALYVVNDVGGGAWSEVDVLSVQACSPPTVDQVVLSASELYQAPCEPNRLLVEATFTLPDDLSAAWVLSRPSDAEPWQYEAMEQAEQPGWYEAELAPFADPGVREVLVAVRSSSGGWGWSSAATVAVTGCSQPTISAVTVSASELLVPPCVPHTTTVSASVSDPLGLGEVAVLVRDRREERWRLLAMQGDGAGVYTGELGPFAAAGTKDWRVRATNTAGAVTLTEPQVVVVGSCQQR